MLPAAVSETRSFHVPLREAPDTSTTYRAARLSAVSPEVVAFNGYGVPFGATRMTSRLPRWLCLTSTSTVAVLAVAPHPLTVRVLVTVVLSVMMTLPVVVKGPQVAAG